MGSEGESDVITVLSRHHQAALDDLTRHSVAWMGRDVGAGGWTAVPSGAQHHAWMSPSGDGAVDLQPGRRARNGHTAHLELIAPPDAACDALLRTATTFADSWTALDRIELALPDDHAAVEIALWLGFEREVQQTRRYAAHRDGIVLGRLRPGFVPRQPGPPPTWPAREGTKGLPVWRLRAIELADAEAIRALSVEETVLFGTLQSPSSSVDFYDERNRNPRPGDVAGIADVDGEVAGMGGLHPSGVDGVRILGMAVARPWQARGLGRALLAELLTRARKLGARRIELSVYDDNSRAIALYESAGFRVEGTRRFDAIRTGGHASSLDMALLAP